MALPCRRTRWHGRPDVRLIAGMATQFRHARASMTRRAVSWYDCRQMANGSVYLQWQDTFEFLISSDGGRILFRALPHATLESLNVHLLGHVLSFSLLARGADPLHGTVIDAGGDAIAFVGDCGRGKSTLAAALLARGCRVVTDDVVALRKRGGRWGVHPGIPRLKLAQDVARTVLGRLDAPRMIHGVEKRVIALTPKESVGTIRPLKVIYVLGAPDADARLTSVRIEPLSARDAFLEVIRAAFNLFVSNRMRHANQFAFATQLVADVPVRSLDYPRDLACLPAVCDAVLANVAALSAP